MNIALAVRRRRTRLGITQEELGARIGWDRHQVCRLEAGRHAPKVETLRKLARALRCKTGDLL